MCENNKTNSALDFIMYSYFGITFADTEEDIVYAAAKKAYNDATMRAALVFKKQFENNDKEKKRTMIKYIKKQKMNVKQFGIL